MNDVIVKHIPYSVDLNEPVKKTFIDTLLATEDNLAHCFDITLKRGGEAVTLPDGTAVTAYFIRYCDNATLPAITGTVSGNVISAALNKACYNKAGQFAIIIKAVAGDVTSTVFYGEGTIFTSMTDTILDPENVVPSLSDLLAQIAVMEEATAATKAATTNAKTATTRANNAAAKIEGMTASATEADEAGVTVSEVDGVKHFAFDLPKGPKGDPGTIENVTITSIAGLEEALAGKLGTGETAADSNKLGGVDADEYAKKTDIPEGEGIDLLTVYPIGSIYLSVAETSPAALFGGTWEQLKDRFLLGAGSTYALGSMGGEEKHAVTIEEMPSHFHNIFAEWSGGTENVPAYFAALKSSAYQYFANTSTGGGYTPISTSVNNGGNKPHNNMPPYLAVNVWKRVS